MSQLFTKYKETLVPNLKSQFVLKNVHQVPTIKKVVLNMGLGEAIQNPKIIEAAVDQLSLIAGQKAVVTRAKKSVASFKLREGVQIGCMVSLRSIRMWDFLDRLLTVALPRVRDFRGLSPRAFDGAGNYTLGVREQLIFPEINYDKIDKVRGMNITIVTSTSKNEEARALLEGLGFPFRN